MPKTDADPHCCLYDFEDVENEYCIPTKSNKNNKKISHQINLDLENTPANKKNTQI